MTTLISQPNSKLISKFTILVGTILLHELVHTQNITKIKLNIPFYPTKSKKDITVRFLCFDSLVTFTFYSSRQWFYVGEVNEHVTFRAKTPQRTLGWIYVEKVDENREMFFTIQDQILCSKCVIQDWRGTPAQALIWNYREMERNA